MKVAFENLTPFIQKMRVIKSADEIQKMIVAGDYADKAVNIGFDNISLDVTETDIIAQIEFGMKKSVSIKCPLKQWFLQVTMPQTLMVFQELTALKMTASSFFDLGVVSQGYVSDMTRTVAVGQPDQFKKDIYNICLEAQLTALILSNQV